MASQAEIELLKLLSGAGDAARRRSRAEALMGEKAPQAQMVGGRYIAPSGLGMFANALARGVGGYQQSVADKEQAQADQTMLGGLGGIVQSERNAARAAAEQEQSRYDDKRGFEMQKFGADQAERKRAAEFQAAQAAAQAGDRKAQRWLDRQRLGLERERLAQDSWGTAEDPVAGGILMYNKKTGEAKPLTDPSGRGVRPPGKMTEGQSRAFGTASRMAQDLDTMRETGSEDGAMGKWDALATGMQPSFYGRFIPREWATKGGQKYFNAARDLVAAQLRKESGAAISEDEWRELGPLYVPMPGDSKDVKDLKYRRLDMMLRNSEIEAGPQAARYLQDQRAQIEQAKQSGLPLQANPQTAARFNAYLED